MDVPTIARLLLRLSHAIAAAAWLGGGAYYFLALRPQLRNVDPDTRSFAQVAQRGFAEWAAVATVVMIVTGVVLMFDRLTAGQGTEIYVLLLGLKIVAALVAFWLTGTFRGRGQARKRTQALDRAWMILGLGTVAFVIGVVLSSLYPTGLSSQ